MCPEERKALYDKCVSTVPKRMEFASHFTMNATDGTPLRLFIKADNVDEEDSDVKCIISIRNEQE